MDDTPVTPTILEPTTPSSTPEITAPPPAETSAPITPPIVSPEPTPEISQPATTPTLSTPLEIAPEEPRGKGWLAIILVSLFIIIGLVILSVFLLTRRAPTATEILPARGGSPLPTSPTLTPIIPIVARNLTFENDFIKFNYPDTLRQVAVDNDFNFDFYKNNNPTGNFISYSMFPLGSSTLKSWILRNEKCGTSQTRKPVPFSTSVAIQGFEIVNLGACPPGGSSIIDVYYFTTGGTVHRLALHADGQTEVNQKERTTLTAILNSITLVTATRGIK